MARAPKSLRPGPAERRTYGGANDVPDLARPDVTGSPGQRAYCQDIARLFNLETAQTITTTTLKTTQLAITRVTSLAHGIGMSSPGPIERAYIVSLQLQDSGACEIWKGGRHVPMNRLLAGSIVVVHLEEQPTAYLPDPFDSLLFYIPQITFDELANDHGAPPIGALSDFAGPDPVVHHLGCALLPALDRPQFAGRLYCDHIAFAIYARLASEYGQLQRPPSPFGAFLTGWQERRAKELLVANLASEPSITAVAQACGLPLRRFLRAFRQTTGMPPYRWLRTFRIDYAKDLLLTTSLPLVQIAYDCGFADQSHFTRVFTAAVGVPPGAWRHARRG